jgi:hypothetical protein
VVLRVIHIVTVAGRTWGHPLSRLARRAASGRGR